MNLTNRLKSLLFISILSLSGTQTKPMSWFYNMKDKVGNFFSPATPASTNVENQQHEKQQEDNTQNNPNQNVKNNKVNNAENPQVTANKEDNKPEQTPNKKETWGEYLAKKLKPVAESLTSTRNATTQFEKTANDIQEAATTVNKTTNNIAALWAGFLKVGQDMQKIHPVLSYTPHALIGFAGLTFLRMPITSILLGLGTLAYFNSNALTQDVKAYQDEKDENKTFQFNHISQALEPQKTSLGFALLAGIGLGILKNTF